MSTTWPSPRPLSPPPSVSSPTTTTLTTNAVSSPPATTTSSPPPQHQHIHATLPSAQTQRHVAEARAAVVASMGNMVDAQLQSRASVLHDNARALDRQERDVLAATEGLRRERERMGREADTAARRLKEVGNVQNWAEVLEQKFLGLEETVRLADGGSSYCSCSCSECGEDREDREGRDHAEMDHDGMDDGREDGVEDKGKDRGTGKGKGRENGVEDVMMALDDADAGLRTAWSDASRSLDEPESSTGTGVAKGSETASVSTSS